MSRLTFSRQVLLCVIVAAVNFAAAQITHQGVFHNISWIVYGTLFLVHPVWPQCVDWQDHKKLRTGIRIGAALCLLIGLITRFGVL